jgi:predicted RecA/RadA family phage recombinase
MANNFVQPGGIKQWTNSTGSAVASGGIVVAKHMIGVALVAIANGATGSVDFTPGHVFSGVPKVTDAVFVTGEKLIWDASAGKFDDSSATPATGDITGGVVAWAAGANGETTCSIMLTPGNATLT